MSTFSFRNQKGFSLVELMVVVAIIGILASIAIPSLQKYMAKARQSEAKTSLASLYTAEKAFFAEYNTYTTDFGALGYQPEGQLRYLTGFATADGLNLGQYGYSGTPSGFISTLGGQACEPPGTALTATTKACVMMAESNGVSISGPGTYTAAQNVFTAQAASNIFKPTSTDRWDIDQNKNIKNSFDGINN